MTRCAVKTLGRITVELLRASCLATLLVATAAGASATAQAPDFILDFPVDCTPGRDCDIWALVDVDPSPDGYADYRCGLRAYEGHKGVDIALADPAGMAAGVRVRAAAGGVVVGVRDGMTDRLLLEGQGQTVAGRECGNGVRIDHGAGWTTQYCHMRQGSIAVSPGQHVDAGAVLGKVGSSGLSEAVHLHLQVEHDGRVVDPFTGLAVEDVNRCGEMGVPLWSEAARALLPPYRPVVIERIGFAPGRPDRARVRHGGYPDAAAPDMPALVLYTSILGAPEAARLSLTLEAPDGRELHRHEEVLSRGFARYYKFSGIRRPEPEWPRGSYRGIVTMAGEAAGEPFMVRETTTLEIR